MHLSQNITSISYFDNARGRQQKGTESQKIQKKSDNFVKNPSLMRFGLMT